MITEAATAIAQRRAHEAAQTREEINTDALLRPRPEISEGTIGPLSPGVFLLGRKLKLRVLTNPKALAALSPDERELEVYAIGYLMTTDGKTAWNAIAKGWDTFVAETLIPWIFNLSLDSVPVLIDEITRSLEELGGSNVDAVSKDSKGEHPPPN